MGKINPPPKVKPFVGLLLSELSLLEKCKETLELSFGPSDIQSSIIPFSHSDYYNAEMGNTISRLWISFFQLLSPGDLAEWKITSNNLEDTWTIKSSGKSLRQINIDPGYVSDSKIVLASTKNFSHRIYLHSGIYAEVTLNYRKNIGWQCFEWTYPDYKEAAAVDFFTQLRNTYRRQCRETPSRST